MRMSDRGVISLIKHEGIVPAPYLDSVRVWTFGIGHTASAGSPVPSQMPRGMPADLDTALDHVFRVLANDLPKYEDAVAGALKAPVRQHEFDALVSFHFNTGGIGRAALTRHLNRGDRAAASAAFMAWRKPASIIDRRKDEQKLFSTGVYPLGAINVWGVTDAGRVIWKAVRTMGQDEALRRLQKARTAAALAPTRPVLRLGAKGDFVRELQSLLNRHGAGLVTDADFGARTREAVITFQKSKKLDADGVAGRDTWAALLEE